MHVGSTWRCRSSKITTISDASSSSLNPDDSFVRLLMARDEPNSPKERTIFPVPDLQIWQPCSIQLWRRSVVKSGVRVSQVKPSSCFTRLEKSVLPSIFDKSISSSMTWNLQSYPTTVLNERTRHFKGGGVKTYCDPYYTYFPGEDPLHPRPPDGGHDPYFFLRHFLPLSNPSLRVPPANHMKFNAFVAVWVVFFKAEKWDPTHFALD